jgi:tRNA threonylcarbamoyladenosine biosynthesis protein TsaE
MTHVTIVASPDSGALLTSDFIWNDEADCSTLAARLAACLATYLANFPGNHLASCPADTSHPNPSAEASFYIELHGTLGAGKTTFTRHLLRALGVEGRIKSPSYAVVEPHEVPGLNIQHFDFYRFNDPQEWEDAGFRDLFAAPGLKIAEWPEKAQGLLPLADLRIHIQVAHGSTGRTDAPPQGLSKGDNEARQVHIQALTQAGHQALKALATAGNLRQQAGDLAGVPAHG